MPRPFDALVIGGGVSGLSTAYFLRSELSSQGHESRTGLKLFEGAERLGGTLGSEEVEGFLFERGPNGMLDNAPGTLELITALGLDEKRFEARPRSLDRFLMRRGKLCPLPRSPRAFLSSSLLSLRGRLGLLLEPFRSRGRSVADESIAEFGRRRLGQEAVDVLLDPMVTGIYAGDVESLSMRSCFPRMSALEREHGSLVKGMLRSRKKKSAAGGGGSPFSATLQSFEGGLETFSRALGAEIGDRAETGRRAESVSPCAGGWRVSFADGAEEEARALVLALPAYRAAKLFTESHPELGKELSSISYSSVAVACLGYRQEDVERDLDGYGFLVPASEGLQTLGMIWTSSIYPEHAPQGHVSIRAMLGGRRSPEVLGKTDEELIELVERETGKVLGFRGAPVAHKIYRYEQAIPQYEVGHQARLESIDGLLSGLPGLFLTGNSYRGVSVNDCLHQGMETAGRVSGYLGEVIPTASSAPRPPDSDGLNKLS